MWCVHCVIIASNIITAVAYPTFITPGTSEVTVIDMRNVALKCEGKGEPEVTYEWFYVNDSGEQLRLSYH